MCYLNSLFSSRALGWLATKAGCKEEDEHIRCPRNSKYRTITGKCNNLENPLFGSAPRVFGRLFPARYYDVQGLNDPIGYPDQPLAPKVPSPFEVSRDFLSAQDEPSRNKRVHSHLLMQWGQWVDHDLSLAPESESSDACQEVRYVKYVVNGVPLRFFALSGIRVGFVGIVLSFTNYYIHCYILYRGLFQPYKTMWRTK